MEALEKRIAELEKLAMVVSAPGSMICRALMDKSMLEMERVTPPPKTDRPTEATIVWSIGIGQIAAPKVLAYGLTIDEALDNAEYKIKELVRAYKARERAWKREHKRGAR